MKLVTLQSRVTSQSTIFFTGKMKLMRELVQVRMDMCQALGIRMLARLNDIWNWLITENDQYKIRMM